MADDAPSDFIREIVADDLRSGKHQRVVTRFPPEPNGYLHIGHAKSICLNFGIAQEFGGVCHLRFDDTNPLKEDVEYVDSIQEDIRWLGFDWGDNLFYASDYFERLYEFAELLIRDGKAYVDSLSAEEIRAHRGTLTEPGRPSPYRDRPADESLDLFRRMRAGEFPDGTHVLRARIDMASPNLNMRDPVLYRIRRASHHRTGDAWCIYPMYDFAHPLSDAIEGITHSICTLEFEDHRPLYDWLDRALPDGGRAAPVRVRAPQPELHGDEQAPAPAAGRPTGAWRAGTIRACRRCRDCGAAGVPPEAIRAFAASVGVAKRNSTVDVGMLEHAIRDDLNRRSPRVMAVLRPLKVVIENWPAGRVDELDAVNNPEDPAMGTRRVPFSGELWIEQDDFREVPPPKYFRLVARPRGAAALGLLRDVHRRREGRPRRGRRGAVHLRSRDPRRQRARRAEGEGHDPLGIGGPRGGRRGAAVRPPLRRRGAGRRRLADAAEPGVARGAARLQARGEPGRRRARAAAGSSSAWATSASTRRIRARAPRCGIAP